MTRIEERLFFVTLTEAVSHCEQKGFRLEKKTIRHAVLRNKQKRAEVFVSDERATVFFKSSQRR